MEQPPDEYRSRRWKCRPSLRLIVVALCTGLLAAVAAVSLGVGQLVAQDAVTVLGKEYTASLVRTAQTSSDSFFGSVAARTLLLARVAQQDGYALPTDSVVAGAGWRAKYTTPVLHTGMLSDFSDVLHGYIFDDGGGCTMQRISATMARIVTTAPIAGSFPADTITDYVDLRTLNTPVATPQPLPPAPDSRVPSYYPVRQALLAAPGYQLALPLSIFIGAAGTPQFFGTFVAPVFNNSGVLSNPSGSVFLGNAFLGVPIATVGAALAATKQTAGMEAFAFEVDTQRLLGSSHRDRFYTIEATNSTDTTGLEQRGCAHSIATSRGEPPPYTVVCRDSLRTFGSRAFLPLANLPQAVVAPPESTVGVTASFQVDGDAFYASSARLANPTGTMLNWAAAIVVVVPQRDFTDSLRTGTQLVYIINAIGLVLAALASVAIVSVLMRPLESVSKQMMDTAQLEAGFFQRRRGQGRHTGRGADASDDDDESGSDAALAASFVSSVSSHHSEIKYAEAGGEGQEYAELSSVDEIRTLQKAHRSLEAAVYSFAKYVPIHVVRSLMGVHELARLGMSQTIATVMFVDLVGFTSVCEGAAPSVLSDLLSGYFALTSDAIHEHSGVVDKFIGDAVMAMWGAPAAVKCHELKATVCALEIHRKTFLGSASRLWRKEKARLSVRVGVHTGPVLAGNIGCASRLSYTVMGDTVNAASRLESLNKHFGTRVLISEDTNAGLHGLITTLHIARVVAVGKSRPLLVFEPLGQRHTPISEAEATEFAQLEHEDPEAGPAAVVGSFEVNDGLEQRNGRVVDPFEQARQQEASDCRRRGTLPPPTALALLQRFGSRRRPTSALRLAHAGCPLAAPTDRMMLEKSPLEPGRQESGFSRGVPSTGSTMQLTRMEACITEHCNRAVRGFLSGMPIDQAFAEVASVRAAVSGAVDAQSARLAPTSPRFVASSRPPVPVSPQAEGLGSAYASDDGESDHSGSQRPLALPIAGSELEVASDIEDGDVESPQHLDTTRTLVAVEGDDVSDGPSRQPSEASTEPTLTPSARATSIITMTPNAGMLAKTIVRSTTIASLEPHHSSPSGFHSTSSAAEVATVADHGAPQRNGFYESPIEAVDRTAELLQTMCQACDAGLDLVSAEDRVYRPTDK